MTTTRRSFLRTTAALAAASPLYGWSQSGGAPLTMQAAWVNDAEFMGYFVALDNGYYKAEGLDLKYLSGGPDVIPEASLLSKKADVALTRIEKGEGTLGKLVQDETLYRDLTGTLSQVKAALTDVEKGNGTLGKLVKSNDVYAETLTSLQEMRRMVASVKQNSDAIKSLPVVRSYVVDPHKELVRPDCERLRRWLPAASQYDSVWFQGELKAIPNQ